LTVIIMRKTLGCTIDTAHPNPLAALTTALRVALLGSSVLLTIVGLRAPCSAQPRAGAAVVQPSATPALSPTTTAAGGPLADEDFSKLPTTITSETLTLLAAERLFIYKGNVIVTQGDMKLTSKTLEGSYGTDNQIQRLIVKGDVTITKQDIEARGQQAVYDAPTATVLLTESPEVKQGESILTAERIRVFLQENRSQAEGGVRVTLVKNSGAAAPSFLSFGKDEEKGARTTTGAVVATPTPRTTSTPTMGLPAGGATVAPALTDTHNDAIKSNSAGADEQSDAAAGVLAGGIGRGNSGSNSGSEYGDPKDAPSTLTTPETTHKNPTPPAPKTRASSPTAQKGVKSAPKRSSAQKKGASTKAKAQSKPGK
jgi:lipopolysaccharide export system protein LptA